MSELLKSTARIGCSLVGVERESIRDSISLFVQLDTVLNDPIRSRENAQEQSSSNITYGKNTSSTEISSMPSL
jgi:hypothetical protein